MIPSKVGEEEENHQDQGEEANTEHQPPEHFKTEPVLMEEFAKCSVLTNNIPDKLTQTLINPVVLAEISNFLRLQLSQLKQYIIRDVWTNFFQY